MRRLESYADREQSIHKQYKQRICISIPTYDIQYTYYTTYLRYENNGKEKDITQYMHNINLPGMLFTY